MRMIDDKTIGANVKRLRKDRKWSLMELARRLEDVGEAVSDQTVSRTESGQRSVSLSEALAYSRVFNAPLEDLTGFKIPVNREQPATPEPAVQAPADPDPEPEADPEPDDEVDAVPAAIAAVTSNPPYGYVVVNRTRGRIITSISALRYSALRRLTAARLRDRNDDDLAVAALVHVPQTP